MGCAATETEVRPRAMPEQAEVVTLAPLPTAFTDAVAIGSGPLGALFVADAGESTVLRLSLGGDVLAATSGDGGEAGAFQEITGLSVGDGSVVTVADAAGGRLLRFSREFLYLRTTRLAQPAARPGESTDTFGSEPGRAGPGRPVSVAVGPSGWTYAADSDARVVWMWGEDERLRGVLGGYDDPAGAFGDLHAIATCGRDRVAVLHGSGAPRLRWYDAFGTFVAELDLPERAEALACSGSTAWAITSGGALLIGEQGVVGRMAFSAEGGAPLPGSPRGLAFSSERLYILTSNGLWSAPAPR